MKRLLTFVAAALFTTQALAIDVITRIPHGSTSVVLPCIVLLDIGDSPAGAVAETGITNATTGLEIKVRADTSNGWHAEHSQASATINAIGGTIGQFETPDANDVHFEEVATSAGCYQLILPDSYYALDDGTTNCSGAACDAKALQILIRDSSTPAFRDTWVQVDLNVIDSATQVDLQLDESCSGHTTAGTVGAAVCTTVPSINTAVTTTIPNSLTAIKADTNATYVYPPSAIDNVVDTLNFEVDPGDDPGFDGANAGLWVCIEDTDDASTRDCRRLIDYDSTNDRFTIESAMGFTVQVGDTLWIPAPSNQYRQW